MTGSLLIKVAAMSFFGVHNARWNTPYGFGDSTGRRTIKYSEAATTIISTSVAAVVLDGILRSVETFERLEYS